MVESNFDSFPKDLDFVTDNISWSDIDLPSLDLNEYEEQNERCSVTNESASEVKSIDDRKRDLIKATLNFAIKSRRRSLGLGEIELSEKRNEEEERQTSSSNEDDEKKMSRRERNRIAARKCRKNRKLRYISLNKEKESLDTTNQSLKKEMVKLKKESQRLEQLLHHHQPECYINAVRSQVTSDQYFPAQDESHRFLSYFSEIHHGSLIEYDR